MFLGLEIWLLVIALHVYNALVYPYIPKTLKKNPKTGFLCQAYFWLYGGLVYLMLWDFYTILKFDVYRGGFLNPKNFVKLPKDLPEDIMKEIELTPFLRWFSLSSPFFVLATLKGVQHIAHFASVDGSWDLTPAHRYATYVLALPVIYGMLSMKAVVRMWMVMSATGSVSFYDDKGGYRAYIDHNMHLYATNYEVGDFYEAVALYYFGALCLMALASHAEEEEAQSKKELGEETERNRKSLQLVQDHANLVKVLNSVTLIGINSFVVTCLLKSCIALSIAVFRDELAFDFCKGESCNFDSFFGGGVFVAGSVAVYNLVVVETSLHKHLHTFDPFFKFLSAKILVSINSILVPAVGLITTPQWKTWTGQEPFSQVQKNLFYASVICWIAPFVSLLHVEAWRPEDKWGKIKVAAEEATPKNEKAEPLLE